MTNHPPTSTLRGKEQEKREAEKEEQEEGMQENETKPSPVVHGEWKLDGERASRWSSWK